MTRKQIVHIAFLALVTSHLWGCVATSRQSKSPVQISTEAYVDQSIKDASETISHDLAVLAGSQQRRNMAFSLGTEGLYLPISIAWDGPIHGALRDVASRIGFRLLIEGTQPTAPTIVHLKMRDRPALHVLRDIGMQTSPKEGLYIEEEQKVIRLKYTEK